jgi:hypothetical protein
MSNEVFPASHFTGDTVSWRTANAILSEVRHSKAKSVPPHSHNAAYFSLLLECSYGQ